MLPMATTTVMAIPTTTTDLMDMAMTATIPVLMGMVMIVLTDMIADGEPLALPPAIIKHERALLTYS